jgi:hypothetical protein
LAKGICTTDLNITVTDPKYLDEIGGWEFHEWTLNVIKIGKELIFYQGISNTPPYTLQNVQRGYMGTTAANHNAGDTVYKITPTTAYGYNGLVPDIRLQDAIADYYGDVCLINGIRFFDFDGQEFLFDQGMGYYSVKRFFRRMFQKVAGSSYPYLRFTGATLSEGSWHYQSMWNVGGGDNIYNSGSRAWNIEGKDLRNVEFANYFPVSFGADIAIGSTTTPRQVENVQATSVGLGATYLLFGVSQSSMEANPQKYAVFSAFKTWETARAANAFPRLLKKELSDPTKYFHLEQVDSNTWKLYTVDSSGGNPVLYKTLTRAAGY